MDVCNPRNLNGTIFLDACSYIRNYSGCTLDSGFLNYYEWQYCVFNGRGVPSFLMFCWLIVLLLTVATTADSFFAPCLVVVTKVFRMSQNLAGVTLLALGNGAPDVFSAISAVDSNNVGMAFGSIFGAGILVNTITAGVIMLVRTFSVTRRPVMKDLAFYLLGVLWCLFIVLSRKVELWSSLVLLGIYVAYVCVTALSRLIYINYKKDKSLKEIPDVTDRNNRSVYDNILKLSKEEIEQVKASDPGEDNPLFLEENESSSLITSKYRNINSVYTQPEPRHTSIDSIAFRSLGRNITLNRITSTSHRTTGFLAKLIMANQFELQSIGEAEVDEFDNTINRRCQSLTAPFRNRFRRNKYLSILEEEKSKTEDDENRANINYIEDDRPSSSCDIVASSHQPIEGTASSDSITNSVHRYYAEFPGLFKHFLLTVAPFDIETWKDETIWEKIQVIIQSPIVFILTLTIPVVDDGAFLRGWCKILNSIQCIIAPMVWIIIFKGSTITLGSKYFYIDYLVLIIGVFFCVTVLMTSEANKPPVYHSCYAFLGFITSIVWIYEVANEIVNLLTVYGVVFSIPNTVLGLSVLAFANSIGDLVSNIALAKKDFPAIGYAACIGGPLFNLLVGIGLPFSIRTARKGTVEMQLQPETVVMISTAILVTVMNMIALPLQRFRLQRVYGMILISLYVIFIIFVILFALRIIKV